MDTRDYQALDRAHYLHPFNDFKALGEEGSRIIERAEVVYIHDSEGNRILDGMAGLSVVKLGNGREELVAAAAEQMRLVPHNNSFCTTAHAPPGRRAKTPR